MKDYHVESLSTSHPIGNYISYNNLVVPYQSYLTCISKLVELNSFYEASKEKAWVNAMKNEIDALQQNGI